jgi:hypothetical protein
MARLIIVEGAAGTGKSTAWRNIPAAEAFLITPNDKPLPFRGGKKMYEKYDKVSNPQGRKIVTREINSLAPTLNALNASPHIKYILIDDFTHYFTARTLSPEFRAKNTGNAAFGRWADFGADVYNSVFANISNWRDDLTVVLNHHTDVKKDGMVGFKTSGGLLDNEIDPVSYCTYVFHTRVMPGEQGAMDYKFMTNTDGTYQAKTPFGCFTEMFVDNDLFSVIQTIEKFENGEEEEPQAVAEQPVQPAQTTPQA